MKCKICDLEIPEDFKCKIPKYDENGKPTVIPTSNKEPCIAVKMPNLKKIEESGIRVTVITEEKL